jgi:hypothetical protein
LGVPLFVEAASREFGKLEHLSTRLIDPNVGALSNLAPFGLLKASHTMTDDQEHLCTKCRVQMEPGEIQGADWAARSSKDAMWERAKAALAALKLHGMRCPKCGRLELYATPWR